MAPKIRKVSRGTPEDRTMKGYGNTINTGRTSNMFDEKLTTSETKIGDTRLFRTRPETAWQCDGDSNQVCLNGKRKKQEDITKLFCVKDERSDMSNGINLTEDMQCGFENKTHTEARQDPDLGYLSLSASHKKRLVKMEDIRWTLPRVSPAVQFRDVWVQLKIFQNEKQVGKVVTAKQRTDVVNCIKFRGQLKTKIERDCPKTTVSLCVWTTKTSKKFFRKPDKSLGRVDIKLDSFDEKLQTKNIYLHPCEGGEWKQSPSSPKPATVVTVKSCFPFDSQSEVNDTSLSTRVKSPNVPKTTTSREQNVISSAVPNLIDIGKAGNSSKRSTNNHSTTHCSTGEFFHTALSSGKPYVRKSVDNINTCNTKGKAPEVKTNYRSTKEGFTENRTRHLNIKNISEKSKYGICKDIYAEDKQQKQDKPPKYTARENGSTATAAEDEPHRHLIKETVTTTKETQSGKIHENDHRNSRIHDINKEGPSLQHQQMEQKLIKQSINEAILYNHPQTARISRTSEVGNKTSEEADSRKMKWQTSINSTQNTAKESGDHEKKSGNLCTNTDIELHEIKTQETQSGNNDRNEQRTEPKAFREQTIDVEKLCMQPQTTSNSKASKLEEVESEKSNLQTSTYSTKNTEHESSFQNKNSGNTAGNREKDLTMGKSTEAESRNINMQTSRYSSRNTDKKPGNTAGSENELSMTKTKETQGGKIDGQGHGNKRKHHDEHNEGVPFQHQHTGPKASEVAESLNIYSPKRTSLSQNKEERSGDKSRIHRTGIANLGNTCYANSVLQVLGKTPQLSKCLGGNPTRSASLLKAIVDELNTDDGQVNSQNVRCLLRYVFNRDDSFVLGHQNDSHAFLLSLLDCVNNDSDTCRLFSGKMTSRFTYNTCKHVEYSGEQLFYSLLMPINNTHTLDDCINAYCEEEHFPDNLLCCRECHETKADTVTSKKFVFTKLPEVLVLQMGRFEEHMESHGTIIRKKTTRISFEEKIHFDLEKIEESGKNTKSTSNKTRYSYELYGVVNHYGSMAGGHYTATVKMERTDRWYFCSDTCVRSGSSPAKKMDGGAYLLFYHLHHVL
ncbi:ubiquitin carboxyl-terminal hydrolase 8-like isoform X2 [Mizuhopecten yessoensis]|uniref:ubiquitinyl hydrolase 1 n=1 Tax=Mizuhopecten yessoensis TaxID=6573 RepID=A0A210QAY6_MIZYE|nr:ubiquitin carboxyl-terminal hydrolase 8-like isoform X2 [Mizuhopecten yessoensis]OWF45890.1 Ubiquitin carboxyl-terminal hydrolase 22 [Mizuhopecten yessoensis]